jgi:hypothetical protein
MQRRHKQNRPASLSMREARRYTTKFFSNWLRNPSLLSPITLPSSLSSNAVHNLCNPSPMVLNVLTLRFLKFLTQWLFSKRSQVATLGRSDLLQTFPNALRRSQARTLLSDHLPKSLIEDLPKTHLSTTVRSITPTAISFTPSSQKTSFIFRRYITQLFHATTPLMYARSIRVQRPRRFIRRKRARLPRPLHFVKPRRSNRKALRSSSTFKYLLRRTSLRYRRRRFQKKRFKRLTRFGRRAISVRTRLSRKPHTITPLRSVRSLVIKRSRSNSYPIRSVKRLVRMLPLAPQPKSPYWWPTSKARTYKTTPLQSKALRKPLRRRSVVKSHLHVLRCDREILALRNAAGLLKSKLQLKKPHRRLRSNIFPRRISRKKKRRFKRYFKVKRLQRFRGYKSVYPRRYRGRKRFRSSRRNRNRRLDRKKNFQLFRKKSKFIKLGAKKSKKKSLGNVKTIYAT